MPEGSGTESVGLVTTLAMGAFLALAALVAVSIADKVIVASGLLPGGPGSRVRRSVIWLANVVGTVGIVEGKKR